MLPSFHPSCHTEDRELLQIPVRHECLTDTTPAQTFVVAGASRVLSVGSTKASPAPRSSARLLWCSAAALCPALAFASQDLHSICLITSSVTELKDSLFLAAFGTFERMQELPFAACLVASTSLAYQLCLSGHTLEHGEPA